MKIHGRLVGLVAAAVAVLTLWLQAPNGRHEFLNWDDDQYLAEVARHPRLSWATVTWAFTAPRPFYYHPLTWLSHVADYQIWGLQPAGHHWANIVLHAVNSGLVVLLVMGLTAAAGATFGEVLAVAGVVGLVFGMHPLQVEAVAWVAERKTLLGACFCLLTIYAYVRRAREPRWRGGDWAVALLFLAALLAKPMAMTLPLVMLALDFYPLRRVAMVGWRRLWREKAVLFGLSAADLIVTVLAQAQEGAVIGMQAHGVGARCLIAARGFIFYLWKLVNPAWLSPLYPLGGTPSLREPEFLVPLALVVMGAVAAIATRRRWPVLLAAGSVFVALLLPMAGLIQVGSQAVADRFVYLAMLAPLLVIAAAGLWFWRRAGWIGRTAVLLGLGVELVFLGTTTRAQIPVWRNSETMWRTVLSHYPQSGIAHGNLAMVLLARGLDEEALLHARAAVADAPDYPVARGALERACYHLAVARVEQRRFAEARPHAEEFVARVPDDPAGHAILGLINLKTRRFDGAAAELERALQLKPELPACRYNLACAYSQLGRFPAAYAILENLLRVQPQFVRLAASDRELAPLRDQPEYAARLNRLLQTPDSSR